MKTIYIHCDGGFGNRFNVLLSGLYLAEYCNLIPKVIWQSNNWCGAEFTDIFEDTFQIFNFDKTTFNNNTTVNLIHENQFGKQLSGINPFSFSNIEQINELLATRGMDVFYFTNLIPPWVDYNNLISNILPKIKFKQPLIDIASKYSNGEFYGVHLRKTDFEKTVDENYIIENIITPNPDKRFFICSDDKDAESKFLELPNTFSYKKTTYVEKLESNGDWNASIIDNNGNKFNYNVNRSKESVCDAIIDLLILSKSIIIETNINSTFLQTAALLHQFYKRNFSEQN